MDLVLKDQQSAGKRSLHLIDTVNAKKRWRTIYSVNFTGVSTIFGKEPHSDPQG
jgi:hypothetical protein